MCKVDNLALGNLGLSVVETKELGALSKTGIITAKALSKQEFTIHQVKGAAEKIPTLNLYPYAPYPWKKKFHPIYTPYFYLINTLDVCQHWICSEIHRGKFKI